MTNPPPISGLQARRKARLLLLGTVLIWGASFSVVKSALSDASPLLFNLVRMALATLVLAAVNRRALPGITTLQIKAGAIAGLFLAAGYQFQTLGLAHTTAGKSAFLTGLVVILVPLFTFVPQLRPKGTHAPGLLTLGGAVLAFAGLLFLTTPPGTALPELFAAIAPGDLLTLICAFAFAAHLLSLARFAPGMPAGTLATLQIAAATVVMALTLPLERSRYFHLTPRLAAALLLTSVLSTAAAFTIQSYAQQHLPPAETAVLLTLEPVFAALTGLLFLAERFSSRSALGAALILVSIALVELLPGLMRSREVPA